MLTIDYDLISPGMKKGKRQDWRYITTHREGDEFRAFLWTCEPVLKDCCWVFRNSDILKGNHCAELPFIPEVLLHIEDRSRAGSVYIAEINYMVSPIERDFFPKAEAEVKEEPQLMLF